jgi:hypothetical protein
LEWLTSAGPGLTAVVARAERKVAKVQVAIQKNPRAVLDSATLLLPTVAVQVSMPTVRVNLKVPARMVVATVTRTPPSLSRTASLMMIAGVENLVLAQKHHSQKE